MNKRFLLLILVFTGLIFGLVTPSLSAKTIRLTFANWLPPQNPVSKGFERWGAEFESKTNGQYKVDFHHGGVLAGIPQAYDVLVSGLADISEVVTMDVEKPFPLTNIPSLPFYNFPAVAYTKAWYKNVYKRGYLDQEFKDVKILFQYCGMGEDFLTINPVNSVSELQGMKIVVGGGPTKSILLKNLGAVGVFGGPPDGYMMLQKGIADGIFISGLGLKEFHWDEFIHYIVTPLCVSSGMHSVLMNKRTYEKMPDDVKQTLEELNDNARTSVQLAGAFDTLYQTTIKAYLNEGGKRIEWSDEEVKKLDNLAQPLWEAWISKQEAKGIEARKVVNAYYNGLVELGYENPALGYRP